MERQPLLRGLALTFSRPWLWWIPVLVDVAKWGLALALGAAGLFWVDADFGIPYPIHLFRYDLHIALPTSLPSATGLGAQIAPPVGTSSSVLQWGLLAIMLAINVVLRAGYLNLINARLHEASVSLRTFGRGIQRFSLRLGLLTLLWLGMAAGILWLVEGRWSQGAVAALFLGLAAWFGIAQFALVTDDVGPVRSLLGVPLLLGAQGPFLSGVLALSVLLTGALSFLLGALHLAHPLWGVLPQAILGTWLSTAMLGALQVEINVKADPTGRSSWPCLACHAQNHRKTTTCAACGTPRKAPLLASAPSRQEPPAETELPTNGL